MRDRHAHVQVPASQFNEAASESAPQLYLQLAYVTMEHWRVAAAQHVSWLPGVPIFLVSIAVSFVALVASAATFLGRHNARGEGLKHNGGSVGIQMALALFFICDLGMKGLGLSVLFYAAGSFGWLIVGPAIAVLLYVGVATIGEGLCERVVLALLNLPLAAMPFLGDVGPAEGAPWMIRDAVASSLASAALVAIGLLPQLPHPHVDPEFRHNTLVLLGFCVAGKAATLALYVYPAKFGGGARCLLGSSKRFELI